MTDDKMQENEANHIKIRKIQLSDRDDVLQFLRMHYYPEEPLTIGSEPKGHDLEDEEFNMSQIANGTSLMAVIENSDREIRERIVGVLISGPTYSTEAEHLFEEVARLGDTKWGTILQLLACVERDSNVYARYNVVKALHIHIVAVDAAMRGRAIGTKLVNEEKQLGRHLEYPLLVIDCTSYYSAKLCHRLGMECVNILQYDNYLDKDGKQVFSPPPIHNCVKTFVTRL